MFHASPKWVRDLIERGPYVLLQLPDDNKFFVSVVFESLPDQGVTLGRKLLKQFVLPRIKVSDRVSTVGNEFNYFCRACESLRRIKCSEAGGVPDNVWARKMCQQIIQRVPIDGEIFDEKSVNTGFGGVTNNPFEGRVLRIFGASVKLMSHGGHASVFHRSLKEKLKRKKEK